MKARIFFLLSIIFFFSLTSCKNVKIEDDYYYEESEVIDGMKITLKGKGYGVYGQLIEKYKSGSIKELMNDTPMKIRTGSADDNNASYNEIFLTFEINGKVESFETDISVKKLHGLSQVRVYYTDEKENEYTISSKFPLTEKLLIQNEVKAVTLYIRAYKFYPNDYRSLQFRDEIEEKDFEKIKGKQVNNEISINYIKIEK